MKLVLLPGLDGTGSLFLPLLHRLSDFQCEVIPLPETGGQDYPSITNFVKELLPKEDFILIAESFSGPIGMALATEGTKYLKGVIFVASFLSAPKKQLLAISRFLPIKFFINLPFAKYFHKVLFLGWGANGELLRLFQSTLSSLSTALIRARLNTIFTLTPRLQISDLPAGYIRAKNDRLIPQDKITEFNYCFKNIVIQTVDGPHFILQANPDECAVVISELVDLISKVKN